MEMRPFIGILALALSPIVLATTADDEVSRAYSNLTFFNDKAPIRAKPRTPDEAALALAADESRLTTLARVPLAREKADPRGMEFVFIPAGCFQMGSPETEAGRRPDETLRKVCLDAVWMGKHEVTFEQYEEFAQGPGRRVPEDEGWGRGRRPVINVSWLEAMRYAEWLGRQTGNRYRLPTEAEWEYAARAGSTSAYPWGDELGVQRANCGDCGSDFSNDRTAPVGSFAPNAWGLHDMVGNVWEWTCTGFIKGVRGDLLGCDDRYESRRRLYKGGSWSDRARDVRTAHRDWNAPIRRTDEVGFRLVMEVDPGELRPVGQEGTQWAQTTEGEPAM